MESVERTVLEKVIDKAITGRPFISLIKIELILDKQKLNLMLSNN